MAKIDQYQVKVPKRKLLAAVHKIIVKYIRKEGLQGYNHVLKLANIPSGV
jgi:hypothetical protein